jgi:hypothetical protein
MPAVFVELLPLILGAALAPFWIIITLLLLASPRGLAKAAAFIGGVTLTRLLQGVIFGFVMGMSPEVADESGGPSPVVSTLLLLAGIFLLITSYRSWRKEDDPDAPPKWMQTVDRVSPVRALGLGVMLTGIAVKQWVFTLSALGVISAAKLDQSGGILAYLLYTFFAQLLLIAPTIASAFAPRASAAMLKRMSDWLIRYNRPITIAVSLLFGVYFTWQGISGLLT